MVKVSEATNLEEVQETDMFKVPTAKQLLEAGVHFGHRVSRGNPKMGPYIYGAREGVQIIDLTLTEKYLKEACDYVYNLGQTGGVLLLVGTKKQSQAVVEELAKIVAAPYMANRWIGGFLTNFEEVSKNIKKLKELKEKRSKGELNKFTKKEQMLIDREVLKLERDYGGVENLGKIPDALFLIDAQKDRIAVNEANRIGVKLVAIADSNADPTLLDFPIPGNDDAIKSIKIITQAVVGAYQEGKSHAPLTL